MQKNELKKFKKEKNKNKGTKIEKVITKVPNYVRGNAGAN